MRPFVKILTTCYYYYYYYYHYYHHKYYYYIAAFPVLERARGASSLRICRRSKKIHEHQILFARYRGRLLSRVALYVYGLFTFYCLFV